MATLFNVGSLNVDWVYRVPRVVRPGETLGSLARERHPGGKGANQSVAAARAGLRVEHVGRVGADGRWLVDLLAAEGVGVSRVAVDAATPTGHAVIQVDDAGENAIFLFPGANHGTGEAELAAALEEARDGDWLLTQNETGNAAAALAAAAERGLRVALNPSPMDAAAQALPLEGVDLLVVNRGEAEALLGEGAGDPQVAAAQLGARVRGLAVVTLGAAGAVAHDGDRGWRVPAARAPEVVDTTGAGDAFTGYLVAERARGRPVGDALRLAAAAGAAAVGASGAIPSIPRREELPGG